MWRYYGSVALEAFRFSRSANSWVHGVTWACLALASMAGWRFERLPGWAAGALLLLIFFGSALRANYRRVQQLEFLVTERYDRLCKVNEAIVDVLKVPDTGAVTDTLDFIAGSARVDEELSRLDRYLREHERVKVRELRPPLIGGPTIDEPPRRDAMAVTRNRLPALQQAIEHWIAETYTVPTPVTKRADAG